MEPHHIGPRMVPSAAHEPEAVALWLSWATSVLETYPWSDDAATMARKWRPARPGLHRQVWALHAEGTSLSLICELTRAEDKHVRRIIAKVTAWAPPAPVVNPWIRNTDTRRLAEQKLQQHEVTMAEQQRRRVEYQVIELRGTYEIRVPGKVTGKNQIKPEKNHAGVTVPLFGTPHAGGIDVEFDTIHPIGARSRVPCKQVITIPWDLIKQANHEPIEVDAA